MIRYRDLRGGVWLDGVRFFAFLRAVHGVGGRVCAFGLGGPVAREFGSGRPATLLSLVMRSPPKIIFTALRHGFALLVLYLGYIPL